MKKTLGRVALAITVSLAFALSAHAQQRCFGLTDFLQAELNEIALLQAQAQCLQQQGDPLAASVVASYIPDHQMQANMLACVIRDRGGDPSLARVTMSPYLGTRSQVVDFDLQQHQQVANNYQALRQQAINSNDSVAQALATSGMSGALRHHASLQVAQAFPTVTTQVTSASVPSLMNLLVLERTAINDLQVQANQLQALGDTSTANMLLSAIPAHQTQANQLASTISSLGGNPSQAVPPPSVAFATRDQIIAHVRTFDTQMVNTYALSIAGVSPASNQVALLHQGQQNYLTALAALPIPSMAVAGTFETMPMQSTTMQQGTNCPTCPQQQQTAPIVRRHRYTY